MAYTYNDIDHMITNALPDLLRKLNLNILLISELRRAGVITDSLDDELKTQGLSGHRKIATLMDDLRAGPTERFLHFCRVLNEEGLHHILACFKVDIAVVYAQLGMQPPPPPERMETEAARSGSIPLWDERHPDGGIYLVDEKDLHEQLIQATPKLRRLVRTSDLWAFLLRHHVMDDMTVEECQAGIRPNQVEAIINVLKKGEVWRTHAFFRCLAQIDQGGLIDQVLGPGHKEIYMVNIYER